MQYYRPLKTKLTIMQAHEVERMRRRLLDQQKRERQLEHRQDGSQQQLEETATKLKWQAGAIRGGYDYQNYRRPRVAGRKKKVRRKMRSQSLISSLLFEGPKINLKRKLGYGCVMHS